MCIKMRMQLHQPSCALQSDSEQQRTVAQFASNLVHRLLTSQLDGSDGLDAPYNASFLVNLSNSTDFVNSLLYMCKQGPLESRHGALTVLQQFLVPGIWHQVSAYMRWQLISLGAMPMLIDIATNPRSTSEMRTLAETSLQCFQGDAAANDLIAAFGMQPLISRLVCTSWRESRGSANQDWRSR